MRVLVGFPGGFLGRNVAEGLAGDFEIVAPPLDLREPAAAHEAIAAYRPDAIVLDTPFAGGIRFNVEHPADLLLDNLSAQVLVMSEARRARTKVLFVGSSCMYPRDVSGDLREELLGSGAVEATNAAYATAKLAGWELCRALRAQDGLDCATIVPANLYGPHDDFDASSGHVIPALMRRLDEARREGVPAVTLWGTGRPVRDFLFVGDLVRFVGDCLRRGLPWTECNVGSGRGVSILELAETVRRVVGYEGRLEPDPRQPDGAPRKVLDTARAASCGWSPRVGLHEGIERTWRWYRERNVDPVGRSRAKGER
jgi:GDP-L-fucose synthase